jgi:hypothetical protein
MHAAKRNAGDHGVGAAVVPTVQVVYGDVRGSATTDTAAAVVMAVDGSQRERRIPMENALPQFDL